jgi:hypothetical protein
VKALQHAHIPANLLFADDLGGIACCPIQPFEDRCCAMVQAQNQHDRAVALSSAGAMTTNTVGVMVSLRETAGVASTM